jgi:hypothetical protein
MKSATGSRPLRVRIGIGLILLFAAASGASWLRSAISAATRAPELDSVSAFEARLAELKGELPPGATLGYFADPEPMGAPPSQTRRHYRKFVLTQYALTPRIVLRSPEPDLVIGNFDDLAFADSAAALGLTVVRDFGGGLMLLRRER